MTVHARDAGRRDSVSSNAHITTLGFGSNRSTHGLREVLHIGDVVLIKSHLVEGDLFAEAGDDECSIGFVRADGIRGTVHVEPVYGGSFHRDKLDVRDFLFVIVDQLTYTAQRELYRFRKRFEQSAVKPGSSYHHQLTLLEKRVEEEETINRNRSRSYSRVVCYGDVVQLQHLRTRRFVDVQTKHLAPLSRTSRLTRLASGTLSSWLRVNPLFKHRMQGEPVSLNEQVTLESVKLSDQWNLNWQRYKNAAGEPVYEVSCARPGRGFYFTLYNRVLHLDQERLDGALRFGLGFSSACLLYHPHFNGYISANSSLAKSTVKLRRGPAVVGNRKPERSAKDIWLLELASLDFKDVGIEYNVTLVLLRHFCTGMYLSICQDELKDRGICNESDFGDWAKDLEGYAGRTVTRDTQRAASILDGTGLQDGCDYIGAKLVEVPGVWSAFVLEKTMVSDRRGSGNKEFVPKDNACVAIRWNHPTKSNPFYLSCLSQHVGKGRSLRFHWSELRYSRDAVVLDVVDDDTWLLEADVVECHTSYMKRTLIPLCARLDTDPGLADMVQEQTCFALKDLLLWLMASPKWRDPKATADADIFSEPRVAVKRRQKLMRELRCVGTTMDMFQVLAKQVPGLADGVVHFSHRNRALRMDSWMNDAFGDDDRLSKAASHTRTQILKVLVRLWLYCFIHCKDSANHFYCNGWMDVIDLLNGHGMGASSVFVEMVNQNAYLVRKVSNATITKVIGYIRVLGPSDTWLQFLKALCSPEGNSLAVKQQQVCTALYFAGPFATTKQTEKARKNRADLVIEVRLGDPLGVPLLQYTSGRLGDAMATPRIQDCLAADVLTEGIREVVIAWTFPDAWVVGEGVLFHGPNALQLPSIRSGGRSWVPMLQVVWILEPERCCQAATGRPWTEVQQEESASSGGTTPRFDNLATLANYFLAQLQLVSCMVRERQMNCIMALQEEYSISLCLSGASDSRLPRSVRAAFFDILTDLWVDRHPHQQQVVPGFLRNISHGGPTEESVEDLPFFERRVDPEPEHWSEAHRRSLPDFVFDFYRLDKQQKMEAFVQLLCCYLCAGREVEQQVHRDANSHTLLLAALRLMSALLQFGFLASLRQQRLLFGPVVRCLDGRTDWIHRPSAEERATATTKSREQDPIGVASSYDATVPLLSAVGDSSEPVTKLREMESRSDCPPITDGHLRYLACDENELMMQAKAQMASVALSMKQYSLHVQISRFLRVFAQQTNSVAISEALVDEFMTILDSPTLSLAQEKLNDPSTMCVDLMMYDDRKIFGLALELSVTENLRCLEFLGLLEEVMLLSDAQFRLLAGLKKDTATIGKLIYSIEAWGTSDNFSTGEFEQDFALIQRICQKFRNLMTAGDGDTSPKEVQGMLHQTDFFSQVKYSLTLELSDFQASCRPLIAKATAQLCSVAAQFVKDNPKNQELMFEMLTFIPKLIDDQPVCALLAAEIFRGNLELCQRVPVELVAQFGEVIKKQRSMGRFVPWYLSFYAAIVSVGDKPVERNQTLVISQLQELGADTLLHLLRNEEGKQKLDHLVKAVGPATLEGTFGIAHSAAADDELIYHVRCLDLLVGLAIGRGGQILVKKPYVASLLPVSSIISLLERTAHVSLIRPPHDSATHGIRVESANTQLSILRLLRLRWLQLVQLLVYDVDEHEIEYDLLTSPLHRQFFSQMLRWTMDFLQPYHKNEHRGSYQAARPLALLSEDDEEFFHALIVSIDSFFSNVYMSIRDNPSCRALKDLCVTFGVRVRPLVTGRSRAFLIGFRNADLVQMALHRVAIATVPEGCSDILHDSIATPGEVDLANLNSTSMLMTAQKRFKFVLRSLRDHPRVQERITREEETLGQVYLNIAETTDPESAAYLWNITSGKSYTPPDDMDFRRNLITTEGALRRIVQNVTESIPSDLSMVRRAQQVLLAMFLKAKTAEDKSVLTSLQVLCVRAGVMQMIIRMIDSQVAADVTDAGWKLIVEVLAMDPGVNKVVQKGLYDALLSGDDSGMWDSFSDVVRGLGQRERRVREIRRKKSITKEERQELRDFESHLRHAVSAMEAARIMVEGHYFPMQQYLFNQAGNARSCNVVEVAGGLLVGFVKDTVSTEYAHELQIDCVGATLQLLTELMQGPNLRNQLHLSSVGMIEAVFKILATNFIYLQEKAGDCYPQAVRFLKAELLQSLLALLEGRLDTKLHKAMLERVDRHVLRERLEFVYLYFVFGCVGVASGKVPVAGDNLKSGPSAAVPHTGGMQRMLNPSADPFAVHKELLISSCVAEELLEDFEDDELFALLGEGLDCLELVLLLSPHSKAFEQELLPVKIEDETFRDCRGDYFSEVEYKEHHAAYLRRDIYRMAYSFLRRFVKTIDVILNGHLQLINFRQPLTAMWYVAGHAKDRILDQVNFSSPDLKAKSFVKMCIELHAESLLIRKLSRFSILPARIRKWAQRNLPDGVHRPFQVFLSHDARKMRQLLRTSLLLSTALSFHVGFFLVPAHGRSKWVSPIAGDIAVLIGSLNLCCTFIWCVISLCIKVPLTIQETHRAETDQAASSGSKALIRLIRWRLKLLYVTVKTVVKDGFLLWRFILLCAMGIAMISDHLWLFGFLLLDLFFQSPQLTTLLLGITSKGQSLAMTFLGAVILTFVWAAIGAHFFKADFGEYCPDNILTCTAEMLYQNTRNGIVGITGMMRPVMPGDDHWPGRFVYDMSYFIILDIMILNTIVGLIVDSFSAKRTAAEARARMLETQTFISCIERRKVESVTQSLGISDGFEYHEEYRQHKWDYMSFIFHLREKNIQDFTGPEQQIRTLIDRRDISWLPIQRSVMLEVDGGDTKEVTANERIERHTISISSEMQAAKNQRNHLSKKVTAMSQSIFQRLDNLQQTIHDHMKYLDVRSPQRGGVRRLLSQRKH